MPNRILQDILLGAGNTDVIESAGDIVISGTGKSIRVSFGHVPAAGSSATDATTLTAAFNLVSPTAANQGVILPSVTAAGQMFGVFNESNTSVLKVYPPSGHLFLGSTANGAFNLVSLTGAVFVGYSATKWVTGRFVGTGAF